VLSVPNVCLQVPLDDGAAADAADDPDARADGAMLDGKEHPAEFAAGKDDAMET
jgi:hypothetical protein